MKQEILIGQTDYTVLVFIRDTAGAAKTALTEGSIDIAYCRVETDNDVVSTDVTPAALSALTDAHTDWGFEEVSATDHPGLYRLDIADAVFASGAWSAVVTVTGTGLDPCSLEFVLVAVDLKAAAAPANWIAATSITNDAITAAKIANGAIDAATFATGAIDAAALAADAGTEIGTAVWASATRVLTAGTNVDGSTFTAIPWNAAWDAEVQSEATDALNAYDPPTKAELDAAVANVSVDEIQASALADLFNTDSGTTYASAVAGSVVAEIADNAGGSALTAAAIADAVWDEAQADHVGAGSFGEVATEVAAILVDTGTTLDGKIDTIDNFLDTEIDAIKAKTDNLPSDPADQSLIIAATDAVMARLGAPAGASMSADIAAVKSQTAAIETDTAEIGAAGAGLTAINLPNQTMDIVGSITGNLSGSVGSVTGAVGSVTGNVGGNVTGTVGGFAAGQGPRFRKNVAFSGFQFVMTDDTNHAPAIGVTGTAERAIGGGAFAACANSASETGSGLYTINLAATDLNGDMITLRFTATDCDDRLVSIVTNP